MADQGLDNETGKGRNLDFVQKLKDKLILISKDNYWHIFMGKGLEYVSGQPRNYMVVDIQGGKEPLQIIAFTA
jgi:hypothetical protein